MRRSWKNLITAVVIYALIPLLWVLLVWAMGLDYEDSAHALFGFILGLGLPSSYDWVFAALWIMWLVAIAQTLIFYSV